MSKATKTMKKIAKKNGWPVVDIKTTAIDPADLGGLPQDEELKRGLEVARERERDKDCPVKYVCSNCGSDSVATVGILNWCEEKQEWEVGQCYDDKHNAFCGDCESDNGEGSKIRLLPVQI